MCSSNAGQFWGAIFPWLVSWLFYQGHSIRALLTWSGLVLNGFIDFLCPLLVALYALASQQRSAIGTNERRESVPRQTAVRAVPTPLLRWYRQIVIALLVLLCLSVSGALAHMIYELVSQTRERAQGS